VFKLEANRKVAAIAEDTQQSEVHSGRRQNFRQRSFAGPRTFIAATARETIENLYLSGVKSSTITFRQIFFDRRNYSLANWDTVSIEGRFRY
jgi:hypothetical protein